MNIRSYSSYEEIVEDSEPEREEYRRIRRLQKQRKWAEVTPPPVNVIEISDEDEGEASLNIICNHSEATPIEVFSCVAEDGLSTNSSPSIEMINSYIPSQHGSATPPSKKYVNTLIDDSAMYHTSGEDGMLPISRNLDRFSFNAHTKIHAKPTSNPPLSRAISTFLTPQDKPNNNKKITRITAHRFTKYFADAELTNLIKCVACDIKWTTRKGSTQKMLHVQSCAKRHGYTDDTIRTLIQRALDAASVVEGEVARGQGDSTHPSPETIFTKFVGDAAPKRKNKRAPVAETVRPPTAVRGGILERAHHIIGGSGSMVDIPPSTQAFGTSSLNRDTSLFACVGDVEPSQTFLPSKLSHKNFDVSIRTDYLYAKDSSTGSKSSKCSSSGHARSPQKTRDRDLEDFFGVRNNERIYEEDGVIWFDDHNITLPLDPNNATLALKPESKPKRKSKKQQDRVVKHVEVFDEACAQELKDRILQDEDLYCRILRYEPITFKTFLDLALQGKGETPYTSGKFIAALRTFLDQQAICFYGFATKRRR